MTIKAQIVCDSVSPEGIRLTTMQLRYPRFIHAEFMTHRVFSRNASSSRAIPVQRMIEDLRRDPAMPVYWGSNKPGMQAGAELDEREKSIAQKHWLYAMSRGIATAEDLIELGLHKQIANRILEPWAHINVVVTATNWENFFQLRRHPDAQPEIKVLADKMHEAMAESEPSLVQNGQWHLPYIRGSDWVAIKNRVNLNGTFRKEVSYEDMIGTAVRVSTARCARVSYLTHDGRETSVEEDETLALKLIGATPLHASPAEHQATPDEVFHRYDTGLISWLSPEHHGNLSGWRQHRKILPGEFIEE